MATRTFVALTAAAGLALGIALGGCQQDDSPEPAPSNVQAFPEPPHVNGPLTVGMGPALPLMTGDRRCRPAAGSGRLCSSDGSAGYQALGDAAKVVVDEVRTAPSDDHTSWETTVRFAADSRAAVRRAKRDAAALGGVVVVTLGETVLVVLVPNELSPRRATLLGLEKAEAWAAVAGFSRSEQGM